MIASSSTHLSSLLMSQDGITGSVDIKIVPLRNDRKLTRETKVQLNNPRGLVNKVLYGEAPLRGPTPSLLYTIFDGNGNPFIYFPLKNDTPFTYWCRTSHSIAVASRRARGQLPPPDLLSQTNQVCGWICFLFRLSYFGYSDLQLFAIFIFEVNFSGTYLITSAENNVSEPPNLKIFRRDSARPHKARAFGTCDNASPPPPPPLQKTYLRPCIPFDFCKYTAFRNMKKLQTRKFYRIFHSHKFFFEPFQVFPAN